jgi:two-component system, cell cycle sensor histidine kinase and response regulator CckA
VSPRTPTPTGSPSRRRPSVVRILVVDDEEIIGYVIQRIVRHLGYQVEWVTSFEEALIRIRTVRYNAILSDFRMAGMNGERFYEEIGSCDRCLQRKLVFVTGDTVSSSTERFLKKTGLPVVSKPFKIEDLEVALQNVVNAR